MKQQLEEKNVCPSCGVEFDCSKSGKCWCYEYYVDTFSSEKISPIVSSCLCENCLNEISNTSKVTIN